MKVLAEVEYEKLEQIGAGEGMNSLVYKARDPQLAGIVAVKEVEKANFRNNIADYFAEAQAMYRTKHDNIVPVHYACATDTHICIAMPFFKEGSFAALIENGPAPLSLVLKVGGAVLTALAQVHLAQLLHLDVKPSNVLLSDRGVPMLSDFGQARRLSGSGVATVPRIYWLGIPPEAYDGVVVVQSDIYQAGLLLYRAVNGDPHFQMQRILDTGRLKVAIKQGKFPRRDNFLPHVPQRLRTIIRKALRVDPSERYQSATEFADHLGKVACELDWSTTVHPTGCLEWRAQRQDQPALIVVAEANHGAWSVKTYTDGPKGARRAKGLSVFWRDLPNWKEASAHLSQVFENLR
jgi:eukaryotic-like serine/threonine-protein kinase